MFSNKNLNKGLVITPILLYTLFLILTIHIIIPTIKPVINPVSNYDKSYNKVIAMKSTTRVSNTLYIPTPLSSIEYDMNTLYIDTSALDKERNRLESISKENRVKAVNSSKDSNIKVLKNMKLPSIENTSFKGYMCVHKVNSESSYQYEFLHSDKFKMHTDSNGIMMYNNYYVVAMGSYYTKYKVGSTFRITLESGVVFDVITGDEKADEDTDTSKKYRPKGEGSGEIIEFIVACGQDGEICTEYTCMSSYNRKLGDLSSLGFQGNVIKVEKLDDNSVVSELYD